jgi:hypothetical protein
VGILVIGRLGKLGGCQPTTSSPRFWAGRGLAGVPGLSARHRGTGQAPATVGAAQARQPSHRVLGLRPQVPRNLRFERARRARPAVGRVSDHGCGSRCTGLLGDVASLGYWAIFSTLVCCLQNADVNWADVSWTRQLLCRLLTTLGLQGGFELDEPQPTEETPSIRSHWTTDQLTTETRANSSWSGAQ